VQGVALAKFRYINHTADVEFRAYGRTLNTALSNAFNALFDTIAYTAKISKSKDKKNVIKLREHAETIEGLVWNSLQDALSIGDANGLFFYSIIHTKVKKLKKGYALNAILYGKKVKPYYSKLDAKGVSRYNLSVKKSSAGFVIDVVIDV